MDAESDSARNGNQVFNLGNTVDTLFGERIRSIQELEVDAGISFFHILNYGATIAYAS